MHDERSALFPGRRTRAPSLLQLLFMAERFIESENTIVTMKTFRWRMRKRPDIRV